MTTLQIHEQYREFIYLLSFLLLQNNKTDRALKLLRFLNTFHPEDLLVRRALCFALLKHGDFDAAATQAHILVDSPGDEAHQLTSLLFKAKAQWGLGQVDACRNTLQSYISAREKYHGAHQ